MFLYSNLKNNFIDLISLNISERKQAKFVQRSTPSRLPILCFGGPTSSPLSSGHSRLSALDPFALSIAIIR